MLLKEGLSLVFLKYTQDQEQILVFDMLHEFKEFS